MFELFLKAVSRQKPIIIVTFLFLLIYLFLSYKLNIWVDESFTIETISRNSFKDLVRTAIVFEGQPPFYFIILFFWSKINSSVFFLRLLSTIFTISSGLLLYKLYRRNSVSASWWILILIFANPFMLYLATEIRCYSLVVFFSLILIHLFQKYYSNQDTPTFIRIVFVITSIIAVNTQYFVSFLLLSNGIYLLIRGYKKTFITYLVDMLFVLASLSWTPFFITKQVEAHLYNDVIIGFTTLLRFTFGRLDDYILFRHLFPIKTLGYIIEFLVVATILINLFSKRYINKFFVDNSYLIFHTVAISFSFLMVYPLLGNGLLSIRHTAILFPIIFLLFLRSVDYFQNAYSKGSLIIVVFSFYFLSNFNYYKLLVKDVNVKGCIEYLTENSKENEPVILNGNHFARPFVYYFNKGNKTYILPRTVNVSTGFTYALERKPLKREEIERLLLKVSKNSNFWIVSLKKIEPWDTTYNTINELLRYNYSLESDTIIEDPKKHKTLRDVQIRKFKKK